jgi:hypothetical protein
VKPATTFCIFAAPGRRSFPRSHGCFDGCSSVHIYFLDLALCSLRFGFDPVKPPVVIMFQSTAVALQCLG